MLLTPRIARTGKTQWISGFLNYDDANDAVEFSIDLYFHASASEAVQRLDSRLAESEFDWMYVVRNKIRVDADKARDDLEVLDKRTPWFRGVLEFTPEIHQGENSTHVSFSIHRDDIRSITVSGGGLSIAPNTTLFRRAITWVPLGSVVVWALISYRWESMQTVADGFFSSSGALVAIGGGWAELWTWVWRRRIGCQPIQPAELTTTMIIGYAFVVVGSVIWAYGNWVV